MEFPTFDELVHIYYNNPRWYELDNLPNEEWRDVEGYEKLYQISNYGRVKSLSKQFLVSNQYGKNKGYRTTKCKILKPQLDKYGYLRVTLCNNKHKLLQVHRLVGLVFIPNVQFLPLINHKDENKTNNHVDNLEWCTHKYNSNYGTSIERMAKSQSIKVNQYDLNGNFIKQWVGINEVGRILNINHANIISVCQGKRNMAGGFIWRYVDE